MRPLASRSHAFLRRRGYAYVRLSSNIYTCAVADTGGVRGVPWNPPFEPVSSAAICGKMAATLTEKILREGES